MALYDSVVMLRGDVRNRLNELFQMYGYQVVRTYDVAGWNQLLQEVAADSDRRGIIFADGWTVILDPSWDMIDDEETCAEAVQTLDTALFGFAHFTTFVQFAFFDSERRRVVYWEKGTLQEDEGAPMDEENGIDVSRITPDDLLTMMLRFGVNPSSVENAARFDVWQLVDPELEAEVKRRLAAPRPWWKFW